MFRTLETKQFVHPFEESEDYGSAEKLQPSTSYSSSSDSDEEFDAEEDIGAVLDEVRQIYGDELDETFSNYAKPVSGNVDIQEIEETIDEIPSNDVKRCAKCFTERRVENASSFEKGQHIRMPGKHGTFNIKNTLVSLYKHHAIVKQISKTSGHKAELVLIHFTKVGEKISIHETTELFDLEKDEIYIVDHIRLRYSPDEIVRRAESMLQENELPEGEHSNSKPFTRYHLLTRNCEHFASWCVEGEGESFQVQSGRKALVSCLSKGVGIVSKPVRFFKRFIKRFIYRASDEIAAGFNTGLHIPGIFLGVTVIIYLIYCCVMTYKLRKKCKNGKLCKACCKREVIALWTSFTTYIMSSGISYLIVHFCLPALGPFGIPCMLALVVLSVGLQWGMAKLRKKLLSPFSCEKKPVSSLLNINIGDMLSYRYFGIPHNAIVTEVHIENDECTVGSIRVVHYGLKNWNVFGTREVIEENLNVNLIKKIELIDCKHLKRFPPRQVVERVRKRVGERKWSSLSNRSDHLCFWSLVFQHRDNSTSITIGVGTGESKSKHKSSLRDEQKEVHLREELQTGQVVKYKSRGGDKTTGIVVRLREISDEKKEKYNGNKCEKATGNIVYLEDAGERQFEMVLIVYQNKYSNRKICEVDLQTDRLFIQNYHPAHCFSMEERVERACQGWGEHREYRGEKDFIHSCILKK